MSYFEEITIKKEPCVNDNEYGTEYCHSDNNENDPGSRCGEIYVGNNAKTWTFICTFCDKSMRRIDEFITHITHAHVNLPPPLPVELIEHIHLNDTTEAHNNLMQHEVPQFNPLDKAMNEYVDYNDFLDVNVQTVPEVILSETNGRMQISREKPAEQQTNIKSEPESEEEEEEEEDEDEESREKDTKPIALRIAASRGPGLIMQPLVRQRRQRKGRLRRKQIKGPAFCEICKRSFQYYSLYRNHMVKHTAETPFQCTICKKGFKSKQAIRYHMSTHQRQKPYQCELCESGFYHEWQFVAHMETHRSENRHPCEVCGKVNRTKFEKEVHMRTHTGDRPFGCEFCLKRFRLRHHLSNHLKLHLTYRCDYCRKQFSNGVPMKKPYACSDCLDISKTDPRAAKVEPEYEEETDEDIKNVIDQTNPLAPDLNPNTCKVCHKTYANKRGLSVHISTKHQNIVF